MSENASTDVSIAKAKKRVFHDTEQAVWVVEYACGDNDYHGSAAFNTYDEATHYANDLRLVLNTHPDIPERFKHDYKVRVRKDGRRSPTKYYKTYPPEVPADD